MMKKGHKPHSLENMTGIDPDGIITHYTCNPADAEALLRNGIFACGNLFSCTDPREVIRMTQSIFRKLSGREDVPLDPNLLRLECEKIMRNITTR